MDYADRARKIRRHVLGMIHKSKASHIGSCFSCVDILTVLYFGILNVSPRLMYTVAPYDRFILSKGHAAAALYATLYEKGFIGTEHLEQYCENGALLGGHCTANVPGVELSTGSLGHGLSVGCGMAIAGKGKNRVFVLLSDGECDEGSVWESALFAAYHHLDNLTVIIDYNKIQSFGRVRDVLGLEPFVDKWKSFQWEVKDIDGHNYEQIEKALNLHAPGKPMCIIAHTIKGKGVSFMEDTIEWHYYSPNDKQLELAMKELE